MAKYSKQQNLPKEKQQRLLLNFCKVLVAVNSPEEAVIFLRDLLSKQEVNMLSKRLEIAHLLINGNTYEDIEKFLKVSHGTISRINGWLTTEGEGFRRVLARIPAEKTENQKYIEDKQKVSSWKQIKRKYPQYFLPQLFIEEIIKGAKKRQKTKLQKLLDGFDEKSEFLEEVSEILKENYTTKSK